jgi:hypothetical protein
MKKLTILMVCFLAALAQAKEATISSNAYEASHVIKTGAGNVIFVSVYNSKASAQFIQLFDSITVPADTAVPVMTQTVAASSNYTFSIPLTGMPFNTGIAISNSSTGPTKTVGAADCFFTVVVK